MTILQNTQSDYLLATSLDALNHIGVQLSMGTDFEEYRDILTAVRPDHDLGVPFDPKKQRLTRNNACWIVGRDASGAIMHTQALKTIDLSDITLAEYLRHNLQSFEPPNMDIDYQRTMYRPGPGARRMKGCIVYHGEFWVGGAPGEYRGTGLSSLLARHAFVTAVRLWNPDYFFGFMSKSLVFKGFSARFGYLHTEPDAIRYVLNGSGRVFEGMMGYNSREDLQFVLDIPYSHALPRAA